MQSFQLVVINADSSGDLQVEQDAGHRLLLTLLADAISQYGNRIQKFKTLNFAHCSHISPTTGKTKYGKTQDKSETQFLPHSQKYKLINHINKD